MADQPFKQLGRCGKAFRTIGFRLIRSVPGDCPCLQSRFNLPKFLIERAVRRAIANIHCPELSQAFRHQFGKQFLIIENGLCAENIAMYPAHQQIPHSISPLRCKHLWHGQTALQPLQHPTLVRRESALPFNFQNAFIKQQHLRTGATHAVHCILPIGQMDSNAFRQNHRILSNLG